MIFLFPQVGYVSSLEGMCFLGAGLGVVLVVVERDSCGMICYRLTKGSTICYPKGGEGVNWKVVEVWFPFQLKPFV